MSVNKPVKARIRKWVRALRSGEYRQTRGRLRNRGKGRCCLGVLCEVYRQETGKGRWTWDGAFVVDEAADDLFLPAPVANWLGVSRCPKFLGSVSATVLNDNGYTFEQIAARIRDTYLK